MTISGIDLIIRDLATTKLKFTRSFLHKHRANECYYCGEGVLMKKSKIPKESFTDMQCVSDLTRENQKLLEARYGLKFGKSYSEGLFCNVCKNEEYPLFYWLEEVITHMNDMHSRNHKQLSERIKKMNMVYDLATGKRRKGNSDNNKEKNNENK